MEHRGMTVEEFGTALLDTEDLDPIYVMLYRAKLDKNQLRRWLLAYWCSYHAGVSSKIAEADNFYSELWKFHKEKWPRGRERRHFRGTAAEGAISWLKAAFPKPEEAVKSLEECKTFVEVRGRITKWRLFGPWIAFKAADMLERVMGYPVKFSMNDLGFYSEPAAAADLIEPGAGLKAVVERLVGVFSDRKAPPAYDRPCDIQEVETCMCKYKSYLGGHYHVGLDTKEISHALDEYGSLSFRLKNFLPKKVN